MDKKRWLWMAAALLAVAVLLYFFVLRPSDNVKENREVQVLLDGKVMEETESTGSEEKDLRVYITLDGKPLLDLPFAEEHTVRIIQPDGGENTVSLTGSSVYMTEANCEGQDCVQMGEVSRENLEERVMGGFIICLPHKLSVEVR